MEWSFRPLTKRCAATGTSFSDGDEVVSLIFKPEQGELERYDVLASNISAFSPEGTLLGQWKRIFAQNPDSAVAQKQLLANLEEFFESLFTSAQTFEGDLLKQLLALLLERRRVIRALGKPANGVQTFLNVRSREEFLVPIFAFSPEDVARVSDVMEMLST